MLAASSLSLWVLYPQSPAPIDPLQQPKLLQTVVKYDMETKKKSKKGKGERLLKDITKVQIPSI